MYFELQGSTICYQIYIVVNSIKNNSNNNKTHVNSDDDNNNKNKLLMQYKMNKI